MPDTRLMPRRLAPAVFALGWAAACHAVEVPVLVSGASGRFNDPHVTVEVCVPGGACHAVPRVRLDTESVGLRLLANTLPADAGFPQVQAQAPHGHGTVLAGCLGRGEFRTWGGLRSAVLRLGGTATAVPVSFQQIDDPAAGNPPQDCLISPLTTQAYVDEGINGVLGVAPLREDCGAACTDPQHPAPGRYYAVAPGLPPVLAAAPLQLQLANPLARVPAPWNGGYSLSFGDIDALQGADDVVGSLRMGLGQEAGNALPAQARLFARDGRGAVVGSVAGAPALLRVASANPGSRLWLEGVPTFPHFGAQFYRPAQPIQVPIRFGAGDHAREVELTLVDLRYLPDGRGAVAGPSYAPNLYSNEDILGMPFFYGRTLYFEFPSVDFPNGLFGI